MLSTFSVNRGRFPPLTVYFLESLKATMRYHQRRIYTYKKARNKVFLLKGTEDDKYPNRDELSQGHIEQGQSVICDILDPGTISSQHLRTVIIDLVAEYLHRSSGADV
jgi:hypothetical protein